MSRKTKSWDYALGMIRIDGLKPSDDFIKLVEQEKKGKISDKEIIARLDQKYRMKSGSR